MDIKISDLTQEIIQEMINEEAKTHAPKTIRGMHGLLAAVLHVYRSDFGLHTALPKKVRPHINVPSDGQIQKLMEIPVLLAASGPMRRGEICATRYATRHTKNPIKHGVFYCG